MIIVEGRNGKKHCVFKEQIKSIAYENKKIIVLLGGRLSLEWLCDNEQLFYDLVRYIRRDIDIVVKFYGNTYTIAEMGSDFESLRKIKQNCIAHETCGDGDCVHENVDGTCRFCGVPENWKLNSMEKGKEDEK